MDPQQQIAKPNFRWMTQLAGGCLIFLFLIVCVTAAFVFRTSPFAGNATPTPTSEVTQAPHILVRQPADQSLVMQEDFSSNKREWGLFYPYGKLEIINGKLILQSNIAQRFVIGKSSEFNYLSQPYYIQADFSTDIDNGFAYGLIFGISNSLESYYLFEVAPKTGYFRLLKYKSGKWDELVPPTQGTLRPFPETNTLSVYFEAGDMELYINSELAKSFSDENPLRSSGVGVFVTSNGYRLIVDNFFAYGGK